MIEFASVAIIAGSLAATLFSMVEQAFARPLALVQAALGG
jgi:energy-converting hydrogenase Eha subunit A